MDMDASEVIVLKQYPADSNIYAGHDLDKPNTRPHGRQQ